MTAPNTSRATPPARSRGETFTPAHVAEHCKAMDLFKATEAPNDATVKFIADVDAYLTPFAKPVRNKHDETVCLCCDEILTGFKALLLSRGGFTWGLAHGEGFCANCKWPGRAMHYAKDADGNELFTVRNLVLQYHPDFVTRRSDAKAGTP